MIEASVKLFRQHPDATYQQMVEHLMQASNNDREVAERLMEFVPVAYGRLVFSKTGAIFNDKFCRCIGKKKFTHFCPLTSEELYNEALKYASMEIANQVTDKELHAVVKRSVYYNVFNKALLENADLKGGVMSPLIFMRPAPMPCAPAPWWKFW